MPPLPPETARQTRAIFGRNNFYIQVGEKIDEIFRKLEPERLLAMEVAPLVPGAVLPLATFFQFVEGLTDEQAAQALHTRLEWKFALHLPVNSLAFRPYALCEFRRQVRSDPQSQAELQELVDQLKELRPPVNERLSDLKSMELISALCSMNRFSQVEATIKQALEVLACQYPLWLRKIAMPRWYGRYRYVPGMADPAGSRGSRGIPLREIVQDIHLLLKQVNATGAPEIRALPEIRWLAAVSRQQFVNRILAPDAKPEFAGPGECDSCICRERSVQI